jgi:hypothetical protein
MLADPEKLNRKPYKRLTPDELSEICRLYKNGTPLPNLAQRFGISERQLHRVIKPHPEEQTTQRSGRLLPFIQEFHSAWIYEELLDNPHYSLDHIASGLRTYFDLNVSCSTVWRHIRGGTLEAHGFSGYTRRGSDGHPGDGMRV